LWFEEFRRLRLAFIQDQDWMEQMVRSVTMGGTGFLADCRYLLHDRNSNQTFSNHCQPSTSAGADEFFDPTA
jgi:hypothetical protein